ncbi:MAG: class II fructose-bisphosphatase, partial [Armatimonadetes bacterium]|nr:class II fructose-bisphosphatase [Armatimonadota bacterium]
MASAVTTPISNESSKRETALDSRVTSKLTTDFVQVTEAAAIAAARLVGRGMRNEADEAAVETMRRLLGELGVEGRVVIGEGERDEAPMLYIGEVIGNGDLKIDIAVDPVEGTNLVANGLPNAIAVVAISERGGLLAAPDTYMKKLAVGPRAAGRVDMEAPVRANLEVIARSMERSVDDLTVIILDRPRHRDLIEEVRSAGARIRLISDGDTDAAIATNIAGTGVHCYMGTGGAPEGVLAAAAIKALGGEFQGKLQPRNEIEEERCRQMGVTDLNKVFTHNDLVPGKDVMFLATGITDGDLLKGVRFLGNGVRTHSIVINNRSGTVRFVETVHKLTAR